MSVDGVVWFINGWIIATAIRRWIGQCFDIEWMKV